MKSSKGATLQDVLSWSPCSDRYPVERVQSLFRSIGRERIYAVDVLQTELDKPEDYLWMLLRPEFISDEILRKIALYCWEEITKPVWEKYHSTGMEIPESARMLANSEGRKKIWSRDLNAAASAFTEAANALDLINESGFTEASKLARALSGISARATAWDAFSAAENICRKNKEGYSASYWTTCGLADEIAYESAVKKIFVYVKSQILVDAITTW